VTATVSGIPSVQFNLTAQPVSVAPGTPVITNVAGAANSVPAVTAISSNGFATVYGSSFAPDNTLRLVGAGDLANGNLPTVLAGACVLVGQVRAPLSLVATTQINFQVPAVAVNSSVNVTVVRNCGNGNELRSAPASVPTRGATPEFLYWVNNADGKNPVVAVNAATGDYIAVSGLIPGVSFTPAKPGDVLTIYGISFGPTTPAFAVGVPPGGAGATSNAPTLLLGTAAVPSANLLYVGVSPGSAGLYQVNLRVPENLTDGDYTLTLRLGNFSTPAGPYLTVHH
jgi:uncharacterized protein (TIGR03437 family)